MSKEIRRKILLLTYFTILAISITMCAQQSVATTNSKWAENQQLQYALYGTNDTYTNTSTFQIINLDPATGAINASWNARPAEAFPFIFTQEAVANFASNGTPATGISSFGGKNVTWFNTTNAIPVTALNTSYLSYLIQPTHTYYYVIDNTTGIVLQLGDVNTGQVLLSLIKWPEQFFNWTILFIVIAAIGAFAIFASVFRYSTHELRIAPHEKVIDKVRIYFSAGMFAGILTLVAVFIITIVLTAIGANWTVALNLGVNVGTASNPILVPLGSTWQAEFGLVSALEFSTYIPVAIVLIGIYVIFYPFFDMMVLAKRGSDKPMEIQQAIDSRLIGRIPTPFNYLTSAGILLALYIAPALGIYFWYENTAMASILNMGFLMIAVAWFTVPALVFLDYYASIGVSSMFWTSLGYGFRAKNKNENMLNLIKFVIAFLLLITTSYNFIVVISGVINAGITDNLYAMLPSIVLQSSGGFEGFFNKIIEFFIPLNPFNPPDTLFKFQEFITVIPFDLLIFFVTVCAVGLYGFYSKFLAKEPLNRPALVLFASYIVAAIGIDVFINVMLRLPNAYSTPGVATSPFSFFSAFTNPNGYAYGTQQYWNAYWAYFNNVRLVFFIPYFADKTLMFCFIIYNITNKKLRENVSERILAIAVQKDRLDILTKFTNSTNPRTQRIVLENVFRIVKKNPSEIGKIAKMLQKFVTLEDPTLNALANKVLRYLAANQPIQDFEPVYTAGVSSPEPFVRDAVGESIVRLGQDDPAKATKLYADIVTSELPDATLEFLANNVDQLRSVRQDLPANILLPFLDLGPDSPRGGALKIIKIFNILNLRDKRGEIIPKLTRIVTEKSESQAQDAIEILGTLGASDPEKMDAILTRMDEILGKASAPVKKRIIRAEVAFLVATPEKASDIFPRLFKFLGDISPEVRGEVGVGMGVVGRIFKKGENFASIRKIISKLLQDFDDDVRAHGVKALAEVGKANPKLLREAEFSEMLETIINEPSEVVRNSAVDLFAEFSKAAPSMNIFLIPLRVLEDPKATKVHSTALRILNRVITTYPKDGGIDLVLNPVIAVDRKDVENRREIAGILEGVARTRPERADKIYPILQELVKDPSEPVAAGAIRAVGELVLSKLANPALQMAVTADALTDLVIQQLKDKRQEGLIAAIEYANKIYNANKPIHAKLYPAFMDLLRGGQSAVLQQIVPSLTNLVCDHKADYAGQKVAKELLPALLDVMQKAPQEVKSTLATAIDTIVSAFSETAIEVGAFLKHAARFEKGEDARIMAISALGKFPGASEDPAIAGILVRDTIALKLSATRRTAMEAIRDLLAGLPVPKSQNSAQKQIRKYLANTMFGVRSVWYTKDLSLGVRKAYAELLVAGGLNQPSLAKRVYPLLSKMARDKDAAISLYVSKEFFTIVRKNPKSIGKATPYFLTISFSPHEATRSVLREEILGLLGNIGKLADVVPALIVLAGDDSKTLRKAASQDFQSLVAKNPDEVKYFRKTLSNMARNQNDQAREGAAREIPTFVANHPAGESGWEPLLQSFLELARDPIKTVRSAVALHLQEVANMASKNQVNMIFQALFRLIREDERVTKNNVVEAFRVLGTKYPDRVQEVVGDLKRLNRKEQVAALDDLVQEFQQAPGAQKPPSGLTKFANSVLKGLKSLKGRQKAPKPAKKEETPAKKDEVPPKKQEASAKNEEVPPKKEEPPTKK